MAHVLQRRTKYRGWGTDHPSQDLYRYTLLVKYYGFFGVVKYAFFEFQFAFTPGINKIIHDWHKFKRHSKSNLSMTYGADKCKRFLLGKDNDKTVRFYPVLWCSHPSSAWWNGRILRQGYADWYYDIPTFEPWGVESGKTHGDIRLSNLILGGKKGTTVDWDLAGNTNEQHYPAGLKLIDDGERHKAVKAAIIRKDEIGWRAAFE